MTIFTALTLICVLGAIASLIYGREIRWRLMAGNPDKGAIELQSIERSKHPNDALLCTSPLCKSGTKVDKILPAYELSAGEIIQSIDRQIRESGSLYERFDDQSDTTRARYVIWSKVMRYPDTMQFQAITLENGKTGLIAYGRAQVGGYDFGSNFKRLVELTKVLK